MSYEEGENHNYHSMPDEIQQKFILQEEKLTDEEEFVLMGLQNLHRARKLPVEERTLPFAVVPDHEQFAFVRRAAPEMEENDEEEMHEERPVRLPGRSGLARLVSHNPGLIAGEASTGERNDNGPMDEEIEVGAVIAPIPKVEVEGNDNEEIIDDNASEEGHTIVSVTTELDRNHDPSSTMEATRNDEVAKESNGPTKFSSAAAEEQKARKLNIEPQQPVSWRGQPLDEDSQPSRRVSANDSALITTTNAVSDRVPSEANTQPHQRTEIRRSTSPLTDCPNAKVAAADSQLSSTLGEKSNTQAPGEQAPENPAIRKPRKSPRKLADGTFVRPAGPTPTGYQWDKVRGVWVHTGDPQAVKEKTFGKKKHKDKVKPKKKKTDKSKDKPKGPSSAYNIFLKEMREKIGKLVSAKTGEEVDNDPKADDYVSPVELEKLKSVQGLEFNAESFHLISERWHNISPVQRARLANLAAEDKVRYGKEMSAHSAKKRSQSTETDPNKRQKTTGNNDADTAAMAGDSTLMATNSNKNKVPGSSLEAVGGSAVLEPVAAAAAAPSPSLGEAAQEPESETHLESSKAKLIKQEEAEPSKKDSEEMKRALFLKADLQQELPLADDAHPDVMERCRSTLQSLLELTFNKTIKSCNIRAVVKTLRKHPELGELARKVLGFWKADHDAGEWTEAMEQLELDKVKIKVSALRMSVRKASGPLLAELVERLNLRQLALDTTDLFEANGIESESLQELEGLMDIIGKKDDDDDAEVLVDSCEI